MGWNGRIDFQREQLSFASDIIMPLEMKSKVKNVILSYLNEVQLPTDSYEDIHTSNNQIIGLTINVVITFAVLFAACLFGLFCLHVCIDLTEHTIQNLIVLGSIALTEFLFLNLVTRNYISADPNRVKLYFAQQLKSFAQQKQKQQ